MDEQRRVWGAGVRHDGVPVVHLDGRPADPQPETRVPGHNERHRRGVSHVGQVRRLRQTLHGPLLLAVAPPPVQPGRAALRRLCPPDVHPDALPGPTTTHPLYIRPTATLVSVLYRQFLIRSQKKN